jgi:putative hydrolase of HD superfamily
MANERLAAQLNFIVEIDKLKTVLRATTLIDKSRHENSAEHSWHLAVMALLLAEHADTPVDLPHVIKLLLVHDIIEIDAGDTPAFALTGHDTKAEREQVAADRLFGLLPPDQAQALMTLWHEFEAQESPESHFALLVDRLSPLLQNAHSGDGGSWVPYEVTREMVVKRMHPIQAHSQAIWQHSEALIDKGVADGFIRTE